MERERDLNMIEREHTKFKIVYSENNKIRQLGKSKWFYK